MQGDARRRRWRRRAPAQRFGLSVVVPWLLALQLAGQTQVGPVTVVADSSRLPAAIQLAQEANRFTTWPGLGTQPPTGFRLVLVADSAQMAALTRGKGPGWGAGLAFPEARTIILRADLPSAVQTLHHEIAHLVLHAAVPGRLPLWFDEGYASWAGGEWDRLEELRLNFALVSMRLPELRELDALLRDNANTASVAYALAVTAVLDLARRNPTGTLEPLFERLRAGVGFEDAVVATTGLTLDRFEAQWQRRLRRDYNVLTWLVAGGFWVVVAFFMAGALWYRRAADRPRRAALDDGWPTAPPGDTVPPGEGPPGGSGVDPEAPS
ncbi:MAG TPA: peptidase MA family metallohydrolase [Gemmatimonadales bacterium]|nr:peptidase MA family metallohydrolase [Gemmatimonadales bacterium]